MHSGIYSFFKAQRHCIKLEFLALRYKYETYCTITEMFPPIMFHVHTLLSFIDVPVMLVFAIFVLKFRSTRGHEIAVLQVTFVVDVHHLNRA